MGTASHCARVAAQLGQTALAQTNHGNVNGALKHIKACQEHNIVPIVGIETYWRPDRLTRETELRYKRWHLVMLAKNLTGWHNLLRISSAAFDDGFYQNPCIDWDLQERYGEGLVVSTSCVLGPLPFLIENGTDAEVDEWVNRALKIHGDDLYFAIQPHDFEQQRIVNSAIISIANKHGCPIVAETDSHYPEPGWVATQKVSILTGINKTFAEAEAENQAAIAAGEEIYELWHEGLHLMSDLETRARFAEYHPALPSTVVDEAIANTHMISARIEPFMMDSSVKMPRLVASSSEAEDIVMRWCYEGLQRVGKDKDPIYQARLAYERKVVHDRDNFPYMHLVGDFVRWAKSTDPLPATPADPFPMPKRPMRIGSGRGSAAGSLISYLCTITTVDPIGHKFKFERFLNPDRKGLPDIDIDFPTSRRAEGKEYLRRKYGVANVADIVAQQHFQPRAALKAVTKTMYGYDADAFSEISVLTHQDTGVIDPVHDTNLVKIREREERLDEWATKYPEAWEQARRLENEGDPSVMRLSKHAGGVAVLAGPVSDHMATIRADEDEPGLRTAWAETPIISICDELGIVKIDVLGIRGMDQQQFILDAIEARTGEKIDLDALPALVDPYDVEPEVMERVFHTGTTLGVNQFSSDGLRSLLKRARPQNIVDLAALNALYRPGPLGENAHTTFADRNTGLQEYEIHPLLEPIVGDTKGVLAFQEQVMELFEVLAGYTPAQADGVRKIIAKLYRDKGGLAAQELEKLRVAFIESAAEKIGLEAAEAEWTKIAPFSGYSFNRAHAGGYSIQAYQDAHLKVHYSLDSYAVLLTVEPKATSNILREARKFDVGIAPPDVNISGPSFTPDFDAGVIRYGLQGIKDIGEVAAQQVMDNRPYASIDDFMQRNSVKYSKCNKKHREILLRVGALDSLGGRMEMTDGQKGTAEVELLGVALTGGGTLGEREEFVVQNTYSEAEVDKLEIGTTQVVVAGVITKVNKTKTKRGKNPGQSMCFLKVSLGLDQFDCTCFPGIYSTYSTSHNEHPPLIYEGSEIVVTGKKDDRGIIVDAMLSVNEFIAAMEPEAA